jgi:hypothetical protein
MSNVVEAIFVFNFLHVDESQMRKEDQFRRGSTLQRPLLLRKLNQFLVHKHSLPIPHFIHITAGNVSSISLLTQILQLFFGRRYPERIQVQKFISIGHQPHARIDEIVTHPLNMSCGLAAPDVFLRISIFDRDQCCISHVKQGNIPSENPKLSTTGMSDETVKYVVPSFISSATIRPFRRATTPYTLPRTSAMERFRASLVEREKDSLEACMSQLYMANNNRGDQSNRPLRHASLTPDISEPFAWVLLE